MLNFIKKHKMSSLIFGDILILYFSLFITLFVRHPSGFTFTLWRQHFYPFSVIYIIWLFVFYLNGLYDINLYKESLKFLKKFSQAILVNLAFAVGFFYLFSGNISPKRNLFLTLIFFSILFYLWRHIFYLFIKSSLLKTNIAFVGINQEVLEILEHLSKNPHLGYKTIFLLTGKKENSLLKKIPEQIKVYQGFSKLNNLLKESLLSKIIIAMKPEDNPVLAKELYHSSSNIEFVYFPNFYEEITSKIPLEMINRFWLQQSHDGKVHIFFKRISDIGLACIGGILLIALFPFLLSAYLLTDGFPIFFVQDRVGKNGKRFKILKLRTMIKTAEREKPLWAEKNDIRVTRLGKFLRKSYVDELPQFVNILKGEMSVIGPRPERPEFVKTLEKEIPFYPLRHIINPGVTGWAQINSFYARSIDDSVEKTRYDLFYVKNHSLLFDINILLQTIKMIFSKRAKQNY
ncbi:sugar transferase [bacterium]|nr:MAG: sugar transferase [bacterium]